MRRGGGTSGQAAAGGSWWQSRRTKERGKENRVRRERECRVRE